MIAFFVSPHGLGHAARSAAVMQGLRRLDETLRLEIFTTVPEWFFREAVGGGFGYHLLRTDIGMVQKTPLEADLGATLAELNAFWPFDAPAVDQLARRLEDLKVRLVVCDIAPMGIAAAGRAGIPSVLIENFTWDWVYRRYARTEPGFQVFADDFAALYREATYHIQTTPLCRRSAADLRLPPVSRFFKAPRWSVRRKLGIGEDRPMVLVTGLSGTGRDDFTRAVSGFSDIYFVFTGGRNPSPQRRANAVCLSLQSGLYHPDLIRAADVVVGKAGYSTLAEAYYAGVPFGYVPRPRFCESAVLVDFIERHMQGAAVSAADLSNGRWCELAGALLSGVSPNTSRRPLNGAVQAARWLMKRLCECSAVSCR